MPTKNLPLTQPLRDVGISDSVVDRADQLLRPIADAGYRRHDQPGDSRPYLSEGRIRRNVQGAQQTREQSREESGSDDEQSEDPGQQRQAGGDDRPDQNDLDVRESTSDPGVQESKAIQRNGRRSADDLRVYRGR